MFKISLQVPMPIFYTTLYMKCKFYAFSSMFSAPQTEKPAFILAGFCMFR